MQLLQVSGVVRPLYGSLGVKGLNQGEGAYKIQRLEVSGAVRPLYGSLGAKGLKQGERVNAALIKLRIWSCSCSFLRGSQLYSYKKRYTFLYQPTSSFSEGIPLHELDSLLHIFPNSQLLAHSDLPILSVTRIISVLSETQTVTTYAFWVHLAQFVMTGRPRHKKKIEPYLTKLNALYRVEFNWRSLPLDN